MKTETVNSTALNVGDVVHAHGSRFRLVSCYCDAEKAQAHADAQTRAAIHYGHNSAAELAEIVERESFARGFRSEYLGPVPGCEGRESIPLSWRADWAIQGNRRAFWTRETL